MPESHIEYAKNWYESQRPTYDLLANTVKNTLENLIKNAHIDYLSISFRAKEVTSFTNKALEKGYQNPCEEITDLAGIRVVTFIESDALRVNDLIKESFDVDNARSLDKSDELGIDKFGYRSFHFICGLGNVRCALPEFKLFKDLVCEIQVRTVLQHAWAEIEHDRNYKFAGVLPNHIQRRLRLVAGLLEVADGEFNNLSKEIDKYTIEVSQKTDAGNFNIELNTISLSQYLQSLKKRFNFDIKILDSKGVLEKTIAALYLFNISTIEGVDNLFTEDFLEKVNQYKNPKFLSLPELIQDAMVYANIDNYFQFVHTKNTLAFDEEMFNILIEKYGEKQVHQFFDENNTNVINFETGEFIFGKFKGKRLNINK